jgi:hypothetical protein
MVLLMLDSLGPDRWHVRAIRIPSDAPAQTLADFKAPTETLLAWDIAADLIAAYQGPEPLRLRARARAEW